MSCIYKLTHTHFSLSSHTKQHCSLSHPTNPSLFFFQRGVPLKPPFFFFFFFEMDNRLATNSSYASLRLPVGYRFCPSDEVFVSCYLKNKALSKTLDFDVVPVFDVFNTEPKNLPSGGKVFLETKYFYFDLKERVFEDNNKIEAGKGHWKRVGKGNQELLNNNNKLIGFKTKFVFWRKKNRTQFLKTKWVMFEFRVFLNPSQIMSSWAGYKIYLKKDKRRNKKAKFSCEESSDDEEEEAERASEVNFPDEISGINTGPPSPTSSNESSVTS
ncbi:hypothetical protein HN51_041400 [Arachis hypogaea]|uniref:NAC domain-containing protein n=1 Tax=Arachis hypogaea TaxID=3818 RepID=A0A444YSF3_ARAHY|nr:NAC domain-containing protein 83 [Arachis ipaensis]XP_025658715.1 NAC domain-containing protein 83 [Arachis hypogaea]QHN87146.1 NAC domain-containing protein [Arachis hypogaea]RYR04856.1 hypothetical protein Ahy_B06g084651 [Arachis hypogaea]